LGHVDRNKINPATWEDDLKHLLPKQPKKGSLRGKHKSLPYDEMPGFTVDLRALTAQSAKMLGRAKKSTLRSRRAHAVSDRGWKRLFDDPIVLPDGRSCAPLAMPAMGCR
jgi:hypothetical protein